MASFVLVHGSGQHAGCWSRVGDLLKARGHAVAAPDLPKKAPSWGLRDHAAEIARSIPGPDAVVVGHSASGSFLPLVPEVCDCSALVFLAAVIPEPGKSVREQFGEDPSMFSQAWIAAGKRWFEASELESLAREFLFHDCDDETLAWALGTMGMMDTRGLVTEPAPFTKWPSVRVASIVATDDRTLSPGWIRRTSLRVLGKEAIGIKAGHCPQVSRPEETARILEEIARSM